jgi:Fic family protein
MNQKVKTVLLSNNDRFYFSRYYMPSTVLLLQQEYSDLYKKLVQMDTTDVIWKKVDIDTTTKSIYGTSAIEGFLFDEATIYRFIQDVKQENPYEYESEILNLKLLYYHDLKIYKSPNPLISENHILRIHNGITSGLQKYQDTHGRYRDKPVKVGHKTMGGTYRPPQKGNDITLLMKMFIDFINSKEIIEKNPLIRGAIAHFHLAVIHPFFDGNGRTARFLEAYIVRHYENNQTSYLLAKMLSFYYYENKDTYLRIFPKILKSQTHDISPFIEFVFNCAILSLKYIEYEILHYKQIDKIDLYVKNSYNSRAINIRQKCLMLSLLSRNRTFTLKDIKDDFLFGFHRNASPRTAQRDLKKLLELNLLNKNEDGSYELNLRALG